jgi:hypothetical protein
MLTWQELLLDSVGFCFDAILARDLREQLLLHRAQALLRRSDEDEARRKHELAAAQRNSSLIQPQRRRNTTLIKALIKGATPPRARLHEAALLHHADALQCNQTSMHFNNMTLTDLHKSLHKRGQARPPPQEAAREDADALQCNQTAQVLTYADVCGRMRALTYADV